MLLVLKSGETTALVGPSGMGKSTIADLILGLQIPDKGKIKIDDIDLYKISLSSYRDKISYISTGGGAFLEYVQGIKLPAVQILEEKVIGM